MIVRIKGSYNEDYLEFLETLFMRAGFAVGDDTLLEYGVLEIESLSPEDDYLLEKAKLYLA